MLIKIDKSNNNPLFNAYRNDNFNEFKKLIEEGVNVNAINTVNGAETLINSIICNERNFDNEKNKLFFNKIMESDVHLGRIAENYPAIWVALIVQNDAYYMEKILESSINIDYSQERIDDCEHYNNHVHSPLIYHAIMHGDMRKIKLILKHKPDMNALDKFGNTLISSLFGHKDIKNLNEISTLLIESGADVNQTDYNKETVAHSNKFLRLFGCKDVEFIIKNNLDLNSKNARGETPIMKALEYQYIDTVLFLIHEKVDLNLQNNQGETAAMISIEKCMQSFDSICKADVDLSIRDNSGNNVFHYIARKPFYKNKFSDEQIEIFKKNPKLLLIKNNDNNSVLDIISKTSKKQHKEIKKYIENSQNNI